MRICDLEALPDGGEEFSEAWQHNRRVKMSDMALAQRARDRSADDIADAMFEEIGPGFYLMKEPPPDVVPTWIIMSIAVLICFAMWVIALSWRP